MIQLSSGAQIPENAVRLRTTAALDSFAFSRPLRLLQYDKTLPVVAVALTYEGKPYTPPAGALLNVRMRKADGKGVYNPCLGFDDDGVVYTTVTQQMTAAHGDGLLSIEVTIDGGVKTSAPVPVHIEPNPVQEGQIESEDEFLTLREVLAECKKQAAAAASSASAAKASEDNAADSETAAASSASAAKTSETNAASSKTAAASSASAAKTSETNAASSKTAAASSASAAKASEDEATRQAELAKDYADQASSIAQGQKGFYSTPEALRAAHPTGAAGDWAIVGSTDSVWVWDVEGAAWVDTHKATNLSNYYTKTQADERFATAAEGDKANTALQPTGNASNTTVAFTAATTRANIATGEKLSVIMGKLAKWFSDLKAVAWSGSYTDLTNKPTSLKNPQALTISLNGASQGAYDGSAAKAVNITPAGIGAATALQGQKADSALQLRGLLPSGSTDIGAIEKGVWQTDSTHKINPWPEGLNEAATLIRTDYCIQITDIFGSTRWWNPYYNQWRTVAADEIPGNAIYTLNEGEMLLDTKPGGLYMLHNNSDAPDGDWWLVVHANFGDTGMDIAFNLLNNHSPRTRRWAGGEKSGWDVLKENQ